MARFNCTVLQEEVSICEATIDVRTTHRGVLRGWEGAIVATDPADAIWQPGEYTFRLDDESEHAALINSVQIGTASGRRITFVGANGAGPGGEDR